MNYVYNRKKRGRIVKINISNQSEDFYLIKSRPNNRHGLRYYTIKNDNSGVSNVVTSIMMLGIFLSILAMIFTIYIPNWAKSGESAHMEKVMDSFLDLKSNIDKQINNEKDVGTTLSTKIKLGAEGGAVMGIGRTTGSLSFHTSISNITIHNSDDSQNIYSQASGMITFKSRNVYYSNQDLTYENGGVIVEQGSEAILRAKPNFDILFSDNKTTVVITLIHLTGTSHNVGGSDYHTIDSKLVQSVERSHELIWTPEEGFQNGQNITINITTRFGEIWTDRINDELDDLPGNVKNNTLGNLTMNTYQDPSTDETIYNVRLDLIGIDKLNCKKGITEIKIN
jgi:hypothetical protein